MFLQRVQFPSQLPIQIQSLLTQEPLWQPSEDKIATFVTFFWDFCFSLCETITWHLKPPAVFFLFERNWNAKVLFFFEAGIVSPQPSAKVPESFESFSPFTFLCGDRLELKVPCRPPWGCPPWRGQRSHTRHAPPRRRGRWCMFSYSCDMFLL